MATFEEKKSLLLELIAFATVDGKLHAREYEFLRIVAIELGFNTADFQALFHEELPELPIRSEFMRIQQFYRLALLMHCDGVLHDKELAAIQQIAIKMGLNPHATKRILKLMEQSPFSVIESEVLLTIFQEQHN